MKINTEFRDDHQVTLVVELENSQMVSAKHRAARRISERKSIHGFRPGKAPYEVVVRSFGEGAISEEAVNLLLDEIYPKALEEAKLEPAAAGSLEKVENLEKEPKFTFTVPLAPSVKLGDYQAIRLPYDWKEPGEEKLKEAIEDLRRMYAKTEAVNRPIKPGDFVMIDLKGYKITTKEDDNPDIDRPGIPIFIQENEKVNEFPFKGFSKKIIGLNQDDEISLKHTYNKDYKDKDLQSQTIKFKLKVKMIRGSILPELNDDFAKQVGPFKNVQAMRDAIRANLETQSRNEYDDDYYGNLIGKLIETATIKYPPQVLEHELEHVMSDLKARLSEQGMDMTAYLKSRDMDEEHFITEEARPIAIKRLERSLILEEIAKAENIEVSREMLETTFDQALNEYKDNQNFQKVMRNKSKPPQQLLNAVAIETANRAFIRQTLNRLKDIANGQLPELQSEGKQEMLVTKGAPRENPKESYDKSDKRKSSKRTSSVTTKTETGSKKVSGTGTLPQDKKTDKDKAPSNQKQ